MEDYNEFDRRKRGVRRSRVCHDGANEAKEENDVTIREQVLPGTHLVSYFHFLPEIISFR